VVAAIFAELLLWGDSLRCESISGFFPPFTQNLCFRVDKRVTSFPDHGGIAHSSSLFFFLAATVMLGLFNLPLALRGLSLIWFNVARLSLGTAQIPRESVNWWLWA
jgi:hypothetical protein